MVFTFNFVHKRWEVSYLDDDRSTGLLRLTSKQNWARTNLENYTLNWKIKGDELEYTFTNASGDQETGNFERQDLENH